MAMTKNRVALIAALVASGVAIIFGAYQHVQSLPKPVTTFQHVRLGMSMDEVLYNLGKPTDVLKAEELPSKFQFFVEKDEVKKSKNGINDFVFWHYESEKNRITIDFDDISHTLKMVGCTVSDDQLSNNSCALNGVFTGMTEDEVASILGAPTSSRIGASGVKTMAFSKYNMQLFFEKRILYTIRVSLSAS
jgi:hypothetical protein